MDECERVAGGIRRDGARALCFETDVIDEKVAVHGLPAMVESAVLELGGIDILINNAGHPGVLHDFVDLSLEDWETPMHDQPTGVL